MMDKGGSNGLCRGLDLTRIEETLIAVILGLMTIMTFANVIARYVFNSNILWALETLRSSCSPGWCCLAPLIA